MNAHTVRARLADVPAPEVEAYLLGVIASLEEALTPNEGILDACALTKSERRIASVLLHNAGEVCSHSALLSALYYDKPEEMADINIGVHIHKIRKKLPSTIQITCAHGIGYRLIDSRDKSEAGTPLITVRPGPVLHVWRDGSQVAAIPMTPRAALTIAQDLIRLATENVQ